MRKQWRFPSEPGAVLPLIAIYHELRARTSARLKGEDKRRFALLTEIFRPLRIYTEGVRRQAIRLKLREDVRLFAGSKILPGRTDLVTLKRLKIILEDQPPQSPEEVVVSVRGPYRTVWWCFRGRVLPTADPQAGVTFEILEYQGCALERDLNLFAASHPGQVPLRADDREDGRAPPPP